MNERKSITIMKLEKNFTRRIFSLITAFSLAGAIAGFNNTKVSAKPDGRYYRGNYTTYNVNQFLNARNTPNYNDTKVNYTISKNEKFFVHSTVANSNGHYGEVKKVIRNNTVIGWVNLAYAKEDYKKDAQDCLYPWYVNVNYPKIDTCNINYTPYGHGNSYGKVYFTVYNQNTHTPINNIYGLYDNLYKVGYDEYVNLDKFQPSISKYGDPYR